MTTFTTEEKRKECDRELKYRHWVYAGLVTKGRMPFAEMTRRIEVMTAIRDDYAALEEKERLI